MASVTAVERYTAGRPKPYVGGEPVGKLPFQPSHSCGWPLISATSSASVCSTNK